jgi:hypothetical protein
VFFDDILIFSDSWSAHLQHVHAVLGRLREHSLTVKRSKCSFGASTVAYLGHVISAEGVAMDADKVEAVRAWPTPRTVRRLLELTGCYMKFIRGYGDIAAPLTVTQMGVLSMVIRSGGDLRRPQERPHIGAGSAATRF